MLVVKAVVTALLLRLGGARPAVAAETGVLMASPSETTLIVLGAAAAAQLITPGHRRLLADRHRDRPDVTPLLAKLGRLAGAAGRPAGAAGTMDARSIARARARSVIFGFGRVGRMVADMLTRTASDLSRGRQRHRRRRVGAQGGL